MTDAFATATTITLEPAESVSDSNVKLPAIVKPLTVIDRLVPLKAVNGPAGTSMVGVSCCGVLVVFSSNPMLPVMLSEPIESDVPSEMSAATPPWVISSAPLMSVNENPATVIEPSVSVAMTAGALLRVDSVSVKLPLICTPRTVIDTFVPSTWRYGPAGMTIVSTIVAVLLVPPPKMMSWSPLPVRSATATALPSLPSVTELSSVNTPVAVVRVDGVRARRARDDQIERARAGDPGQRQRRRAGQPRDRRGRGEARPGAAADGADVDVDRAAVVDHHVGGAVAVDVADRERGTAGAERGAGRDRREGPRAVVGVDGVGPARGGDQVERAAARQRHQRQRVHGRAGAGDLQPAKAPSRSRLG